MRVFEEDRGREISCEGSPLRVAGGLGPLHRISRTRNQKIRARENNNNTFPTYSREEKDGI